MVSRTAYRGLVGFGGSVPALPEHGVVDGCAVWLAHSVFCSRSDCIVCGGHAGFRARAGASEISALRPSRAWRVCGLLCLVDMASDDPDYEMKQTWPNKPAAGNAGIAPQLAIGHHWPGVPEPER